MEQYLLRHVPFEVSVIDHIVLVLAIIAVVAVFAGIFFVCVNKYGIERVSLERFRPKKIRESFILNQLRIQKINQTPYEPDEVPQIELPILRSIKEFFLKALAAVAMGFFFARMLKYYLCDEKDDREVI